ncbi:arylsulfatase [Sphingomonas bacterium]|uniref:arylsulfatase n=1 Tax=Sphingomonas bacterium TaxID=1895847 RepID=UPI001576EF81|nr:arylsulfatase [Sphingomonas bacterium]
MKRMFLAVATALASTALAAAASAQTQPKRPNFLIIVADDLGFSDIGAFGSEIDTPNLDALALSGLRFTGFHTAPACSPTRSMLLTGSDSHRVGLGAMSEVTQDNQRGHPGFEGYLRADAPTLAERLSDAGYRTLFSGKWHLGVTPQQDPHARGFQHSFVLAQGGHNHFGLDQSSDPLTGSTYREDGVLAPKLPVNFYSSDYFADKLVAQIKDTKAGPDGAKPFFAYLAFTAPHFPLQAPPETIAKYKGRYDAGYEVLRQQRLDRQRQLGLVAPTTVPHPLIAARSWASLSPQDKQVASREMETYAAMVDRLDKAVGRVVAELKRTGEFDNTVILFLADNGAEGMDLAGSALPVVRRLAKNSSFDTIGSAQSYVSYGPGWAQAATAPSYRFKAYATEGGTRTVSFLSGPVVRAPAVTDAYLHVTDVAPTFLDLAGVKVEPGTFEGKTVQPIDGLSWRPLLTANKPVYAADRPIGNELFGSRSIREGDWKITDISDGRWRLYDIAADPGETRDLSDREPTRKAALIKAWDAYAARVGIVLPSPRLHPHPLLEGE